MKRLLCALCSFCVLCGCSSAPPGPDNEAAFKYLDEGREAARKGDHPAAVTLYTQSLRANPDLAEAYFERGSSNVQLRLSRKAEGDARLYEERAIDDFTRATQKNPAYADAYYNRAMIGSSRAQYRQAADDLLRTIQLKPRDPMPHLYLGELYEHKFEDRAAAAYDHYEKYVDLGGTDSAAREKVRLWKELKKQAAQPSSKAPTPQEEQKARELHEEFKKLFADGKKPEALKAVETLMSQYGHTKYVQERVREFSALLNALKPKP